VVKDDQPDAREGQAGRPGVAERFAVPLKPGNAGGGKGPQFKTDARRGEGPGDWATSLLSGQNHRWDQSVPYVAIAEEVASIMIADGNCGFADYLIRIGRSDV